jgi:formylglycine-generating enzyme required for sulfatase activity
MPPTADDPLRTTDHVPVGQPEALANEARVGPATGESPSSGADQATVAFGSKRAAEPAAYSEPPSVPGYQIEGLLGRGGMGIVYKARQTKANRVVALKMILQSKHASVQEQVRFQIEAEAVARLQHPNIVQLYEVGEHDGLPFFSLEFCAGGSLGQRYASAEGLADDTRRFLRGEPIAARAVGHVERAVKWARRRPAVAALLLVSVLGVAGIVWKYLDAEQQRGLAESKKTEAVREADKAKKARDFLVSIFELSDAKGLRGTMTARQILEDAEKRIPRDFADQPELQAELLAAIEAMYAKITAASPLAMILQVRGTVRLQSTRDPGRRPVPQTLLSAGDRLNLAADAGAELVFLCDFHKERLQSATEATIARKGCEPAGAIGERSDDLVLTFVPLPKGTFYMGWDGTKKGVKTEIKEDFEIAVYTVTQGQWQALMGDNPSHFSRFGHFRQSLKDVSDEELRLFPVEGVSWDDVQEFIKRLNEHNRGRGWQYRLPTEAEWEYACRCGATSEEECSYHFYLDRPTNDLSSADANFAGGIPDGNAPQGPYLQRTTRVGSYPPNKLGLCDMHGNVWQRCADRHDESGELNRVVRGGYWGLPGRACRTATRYPWQATARQPSIGFRLVRVPVR